MITTATGESVLTESHQLYLDWLVYGDSRTDKALVASDLGVTLATLKRWEKEPKFRAEWRKLELRKAFDPSVTSKIMQALAGAATDPDAKDRVSAAKLYLDHAATFAGLDAPADSDAVTVETDEHAQFLLKTHQERREGFQVLQGGEAA